MQSVDYSIRDFSSGFRSGNGSIKSCGAVEKLNAQFKLGVSWMASSWGVFKVVLKANRFNVLAGQQQNIVYGAATLVGINFFSLITNQHCRYRDYSYGYGCYDVIQGKKNGFNHLCCEIWALTPKLILITNIALMALDATINPFKAAVGFSFLVLSALDQKEMLPPGLHWVLNTALPLPTMCVSLYYGDAVSRSIILVEKAVSLILMQ